MTPIGLARFFLLTALSFHSIEGKSILLSSKEGTDLKSSDKRASNFRMNVETPFDPNFWPARGRRGRRDPEKADDCIGTNDYFEFQCQQERSAKKSDSNIAFTDSDSGISSDGLGMVSDCYGSLVGSQKEEIKKKLTFDAMNPKTAPRLNQLRSNRRRRQRILPPSRFLAHGNGLSYEPGNSFGEKMKKQDVFWVVRGKKNFR